MRLLGTGDGPGARQAKDPEYALRLLDTSQGCGYGLRLLSTG